jgi:nicotinamidase/pyrazinamidase
MAGRSTGSSAHHEALIVVDVQLDFCPGGALPAATGNDIIPAANRYLAEARRLGMPIYASRDWHPPVTGHFKPYGGEWPPHCVQNTSGARFHPGLQLPPGTIVISKGEDPEREGYSAFDGRTPDGRPLLEDLRDRRIDTVYVAGLTAEYCVKQTILDALKAGLHAVALTDAIAGLNAQPGDVDRALEEIRRAGAELQVDYFLELVPRFSSPSARTNVCAGAGAETRFANRTSRISADEP